MEGTHGTSIWVLDKIDGTPGTSHSYFSFLTVSSQFFHPQNQIGRFNNHDLGVKDGAPGPMIIHQDGSQKKWETALTRTQKNGAAPPPTPHVSPRFSKGLLFQGSNEAQKNPMAIAVGSSSSGSMTQPNFYKFAKHFVESLPKQKEGEAPVARILFLDGHSSRWSVAALRYLMENHVFPFFLPSHTSIWSQPNDCGTNKSLHHYFAAARRASGKFNDETSVSYFNRIFESGWKQFVMKEHEELTVNREPNQEKPPIFHNATTRSFKRTGIHPLNVHASSWKEAEETIGLAFEFRNERDNGMVNSWEVRVRKDSTGALSQEEENIVKGYLPSDGEERHILVHGKVVMDSILKRWREQVKELEKQGKWKEAFQLEPKGIEPHEIIAERLFQFERPDVDSIPKAKEEEKEDIEKRYAASIVLACGSGRTGTIKVTYSESDDDNELTRTEGNAMRRQNDQWYVGLDDGRSMMVSTDDLLDRTKFDVAQLATSLSEKDKEKYAKQKKRESNRVDGECEREASRVAHQRRNEMKKTLFRDLNERIRTGKPFDWGEFLNMTELLEKPYKTTVGSYEFAVGGASSEACIKTMAGKLISDCISGKKRKKNEDDESERPAKTARPNQRRVQTWHGGNDTVTGEATLSARDVVDAEKSIEVEGKRLSRSILAIKTALTKFTTLTNNEREKCQQDPSLPPYWVLSEDRTWEYLRTYVRIFHLPGDDGKQPIGGGLLGTKDKRVLLDVFTQLGISESKVTEQIALATTKLRDLKERLRELAPPDSDSTDESTEELREGTDATDEGTDEDGSNI